MEQEKQELQEEEVKAEEQEDEILPADDLEPDEEETEEETPAEEHAADEKTGRYARVTRERKEALEKARMSEERARLLELQLQNLSRPPVDENLSEDEKWRRQANEAIQRTQFQTMDMADRSAYQVKSITSPVYRKWEPKVESELSKARAQGLNPSRENILKFLLGEAALGRVKTPTERKKTPARQAAESVTRPGGKSTVSPGSEKQSLRERLMGVKL